MSRFLGLLRNVILSLVGSALAAMGLGQLTISLLPTFGDIVAYVIYAIYAISFLDILGLLIENYQATDEDLANFFFSMIRGFFSPIALARKIPGGRRRII
ncbi:hypothetical protein A2V49_01480 [candidate division WWE3 bacterium RBG_19FT_COMBO_34_6]|uniref:Uncharacterized protein n=1 Tax=candidate division WWE3 bacterium RBG_19FT_COMBO_34_6 TaxID=1802612 RepID=A0A1F4UM20_UNCKA|nr:MAG: hypothetical protein A2V49_01480 [candidate division WWE3 bacterium RBG_19FT_COMBO_34_6]